MNDLVNKQTYYATEKRVTCQLFTTEKSDKQQFVTVTAQINGILQYLILDTGSSISIVGNSHLQKNAKIINVRTQVNGIANKI